jgi:cytochrome b561
MENQNMAFTVEKYPLPVRLLHWVRAVLIGAQLWTGWTMVRLDDNLPAKFNWYYPTHKEFGLLTLLVVLTQLAIRSMQPSLPSLPSSLPALDRKLAKAAHYLLYALAIIVPLMGYSMSSTFTQSDGVPFFFFRVPELLPKNDHWFEVFQWLHRTLAYTLLALVVLHILGALKHRFFDSNRENDVLRRML